MRQMKMDRTIGVMLVVFALAMSCGQMDIGQKPTLTMSDVRELGPADLADFAISLYNKQADWYRDRINRWDTLTEDQQKQTARDYKLLTESWGPIDLYDRLIAGGQSVTDDLRIEIYRFIEKYLGGD